MNGRQRGADKPGNFRAGVVDRFGLMDKRIHELRIDAAERFAVADKDFQGFRVEVAERICNMGMEIEGFRAGVETELRITRRRGVWLLGAAFDLIAMLIMVAATIGCSASAVVAEIKRQSQRLGGIENRLDSLEMCIVSRVSPAPPRTAAMSRATSPRAENASAKSGRRAP